MKLLIGFFFAGILSLMAGCPYGTHQAETVGAEESCEGYGC